MSADDWVDRYKSQCKAAGLVFQEGVQAVRDTRTHDQRLADQRVENYAALHEGEAGADRLDKMAWQANRDFEILLEAMNDNDDLTMGDQWVYKRPEGAGGGYLVAGSDQVMASHLETAQEVAERVGAAVSQALEIGSISDGRRNPRGLGSSGIFGVSSGDKQQEGESSNV